MRLIGWKAGGMSKMHGEAVLCQRVRHQLVVGGERLGHGEQFAVLLHGVGADRTG